MTRIYFINFYIYYMLKQYFGYFMLNILFKLVPIHVFYNVAARRFKMISEAPITFLLESTWVCV